MKSGVWANDRSREIHDKYYETLDEARARATQDDTSSSQESPAYINDNAHYLDIVEGKSKKGVVYGLGGLGDHYLASSSRQPRQQDVPGPTASIEEIQEMRETITKLNAEITENRAAQEAVQASMSAQLQWIFEHFHL